MRTTVTLDSDVESLINENIRRTRRPFKRVLNEALRVGLRVQVTATEPVPFQVKPKGLGFRAGLDPRGLGKMADELEVESFQQLTVRLGAGEP